MFQIFIKVRGHIQGGRAQNADVLANLFSYTAALGVVDMQAYRESFDTEAEAAMWIHVHGERGTAYFILPCTMA